MDKKFEKSGKIFKKPVDKWGGFVILALSSPTKLMGNDNNLKTNRKTQNNVHNLHQVRLRKARPRMQLHSLGDPRG